MTLLPLYRERRSPSGGLNHDRISGVQVGLRPRSPAVEFDPACRGYNTMPASGRDALQVAQIVDAAYESSRVGGG